MFPQRVFAKTNRVHFINYEQYTLEEIWTTKYFKSYAYKEEERIKAIINYFFKNESNLYTPAGVRVISVSLKEELLILDVTPNINNYGGTFFELALKKQLLKTSLDIDGVKKVTLLINGELKPLAEGTIIEEETCWQG
jgi:spore germination protein GerM